MRRIRNPYEFASRFFPLLKCHFHIAGVVLDFEAPDEMALYADIVKDVQAVVPDYKLVITPDKDITD